MADHATVMRTTYKPGAAVQASGIYRVLHDRAHTDPHEVTVVFGKTFPPCGNCRHPEFKAVRLAEHVNNNDNFK